MEISVDWSGSYPSLCFGEWAIIIDGIKLSGLESGNFDTRKEYGSWHFENWDDVWEYEVQGMDIDKWVEYVIKNDTNGLRSSLERHGFKDIEQVLENLYPYINDKDWKHSSCGGCI